MAKKSNKSKLEKKISGGINILVMLLYAAVIAAAVIRELMDRKENKQDE